MSLLFAGSVEGASNSAYGDFHVKSLPRWLIRLLSAQVMCA